MARLGKRPVDIPDGVKVSVNSGKINVENSKEKFEQDIFRGLEVIIEDKKIFFKNVIPEKEKKLFRQTEAYQGLLRKLTINMIRGLTEGFEKILEMEGVGYKAEVKGKKLILSVGFSNPVEMDIPEGITVAVTKNTTISIKGVDIQKVGNYTAVVRKVHPPEPYKGKGIRYQGEYVRHKAGKAGVGATQ